MRTIYLASAILALALTNPASAQTSCGEYDFARPYAQAFLSGDAFGGAEQANERITTLADGACHQTQLLALLPNTLGPAIGYKAAATSEGAQQQLGLDGPVLGVFLRDMLHEDGAVIAIDSGARMIFELDFLARVGSDAINTATTREEALAALDAVLPFIELGDLMVPKGVPITGPLLQAMNAGARAGVVGTPVMTGDLTPERLALITGTLTQDGTVVAEAPATALLGHPLDAVLWIVEATNARGFTLKEGDVLSLGSLGRFQLASPGTIEATYTGLADAPVTVSVTLE